MAIGRKKVPHPCSRVTREGRRSRCQGVVLRASAGSYPERGSERKPCSKCDFRSGFDKVRWWILEYLVWILCGFFECL